jgi:hypothetical protein
VERVDDGVAPAAILVVARRQEDDGAAIDGIAFEIALESGAVNVMRSTIAGRAPDTTSGTCSASIVGASAAPHVSR